MIFLASFNYKSYCSTSAEEKKTKQSQFMPDLTLFKFSFCPMLRMRNVALLSLYHRHINSYFHIYGFEFLVQQKALNGHIKQNGTDTGA